MRDFFIASAMGLGIVALPTLILLGFCWLLDKFDAFMIKRCGKSLAELRVTPRLRMMIDSYRPLKKRRKR